MYTFFHSSFSHQANHLNPNLEARYTLPFFINFFEAIDHIKIIFVFLSMLCSNFLSNLIGESKFRFIISS